MQTPEHRLQIQGLTAEDYDKIYRLGYQDGFERGYDKGYNKGEEDTNARFVYSNVKK